MANEISHALLQTNGGQVAALLSDLLFEQLYDPSDLRSVMTFVPFNGVGSDTLDVTLDAVPGAMTAATSETDGSNVTNAAYTTSKFSLVLARYKRVYQLTDLLGVSGGVIDLDRAVMKLMQGLALTMTDLICALFPSLANDVGPGSGVDLTVDDIYAAQFQLNGSNVAATAANPYVSVLHNQQMNDFRTSLRGETGAIQFVAASAEMLATKGPGFQGTWNGIDFYQSDSVTTVAGGADRSGAMFGQGCFGYTLGPVSRLGGHVNPQDVLAEAGDQMLVERSRDAGNGMTSAIASAYPSVVEIEDARGVEIVSDA